MPVVVPLHEGDALPLDGVGDDAGRAPFRPLHLFHGGDQGVEIVAVDFQDMPAKGAPLFGHLGERIHAVSKISVLREPELLDLVIVHDGGQVVRLVIIGHPGHLPDLPLFDLAVTQQDPGVEVLAEPLRRQSHAERRAGPRPQRAGGHVDAGGLGHVRVALHAGVDRVVGVDLFERKEALEGQRGVQGYAAMALGEDETIPIGPLRVCGVHAEHLEVEGDDGLHHGQRAADVARPRLNHSFQNHLADPDRLLLEVPFQRRVNGHESLLPCVTARLAANGEWVRGLAVGHRACAVGRKGPRGPRQATGLNDIE